MLLRTHSPHLLTRKGPQDEQDTGDKFLGRGCFRWLRKWFNCIYMYTRCFILVGQVSTFMKLTPVYSKYLDYASPKVAEKSYDTWIIKHTEFKRNYLETSAKHSRLSYHTQCYATIRTNIYFWVKYPLGTGAVAVSRPTCQCPSWAWDTAAVEFVSYQMLSIIQ